MGGLVSHRETTRRETSAEETTEKFSVEDFIHLEEVDFSFTFGLMELGKLYLCKRLVWREAFLYSFPKGICDMNNLESLDLSKNFIKQFPPEILNLKNLTELNLNSSRLVELPEMIENMENIKKLMLSGNDKLLNPFKVIRNLHNLEYLNISSCDITDNMLIDLHLLSNLTYLDISNYQISIREKDYLSKIFTKSLVINYEECIEKEIKIKTHLHKLIRVFTFNKNYTCLGSILFKSSECLNSNDKCSKFKYQCEICKDIYYCPICVLNKNTVFKTKNHIHDLKLKLSDNKWVCNEKKAECRQKILTANDISFSCRDCDYDCCEFCLVINLADE